MWFLQPLAKKPCICNVYSKVISNANKTVFCKRMHPSTEKILLCPFYRLKTMFSKSCTMRALYPKPWHKQVSIVQCTVKTGINTRPTSLIKYACDHKLRQFYEGSSKKLLWMAFHTQEQCMLDWFCAQIFVILSYMHLRNIEGIKRISI